MPQRSWNNCHHRQRRLLPSETFRFAPSRRSSLRSFRVLATLSLAPALHAVPSRHPFTWPWAAMGFARAQPAARLANNCSRLPRRRPRPPVSPTSHTASSPARQEGRSGRQVRKARPEGRTGRQVRKARPEGRTGRQEGKAGRRGGGGGWQSNAL